MPITESQYDSTVWTIHSLLYEVKTINERMALLDRLSRLPFGVVVEIALRDGFNIYELVDFIHAANRQQPSKNEKVIPLR